VVVSVFVQGTTIPLVSRMLRLDVPLPNRIAYPIEFEKSSSIDAELADLIVPYNSVVVGRKIGELGVPDKCLIVLVSRAGRFVIPSGGLALEGGDVLLILANSEDFSALQTIVVSCNRVA
jgi:cell volume regulation protein A